jgi:hypothetical protein
LPFRWSGSWLANISWRKAPNLTDPELRPLNGADRAALEAFPCASFDQPGSVEIERMTREELPDSLEVGLVQAEGLWVGDHLVAVDAWRTERDPAVRYRWGDQV